MAWPYDSGQNFSPVPNNFFAPQNQVPAGFFNPPLPTPNPMRPGVSPPAPMPWGGIANAVAGAMVPGGGAAPGAANFARPPAATGPGGQPQPGQATPGALPQLNYGDYSIPWNPQTLVPPMLAGAGIPNNGLLAPVVQPFGGQTQTTPQKVPTQAGDTEPPPPKPQRKPPSTTYTKPAPPQEQRKQQGDQARYTSAGVKWEAGEKGAPTGGQFSGGFGYQAWRRPKR